LALLALLVALPVAALERLPPPENRPNAGLLAQVKSEIPPEVQGWFDAAKTAAAKGDSAEALRLQKQVVAWVKANRPALDVFRARALINFGTFLSAVGQRQEALAPTEEAVRILRQVEVNQPEPPRFLAMALTNLGIRYSNLGRRQEALAPTEEAVKIYRELAKFNPAYLGNLASSLTNLGNRYSELGRRQEALAPIEEAYKIHRALAEVNPAFLPDLANSLNSLGISLRDLGRRQEALAPIEEAVKIRRKLAKINQAFLPDLANSLTNLGNRYSELGRRQEALAPTEEAVKIYRELAKTNPAFLPDVAVALINLGVRNTELGRHKEALAQNEEAVKIYRELAKYNPAYLPDVAVALNNMGIRTGPEKMLPAADLSYLPKNDPTNALKRSVVRLWPTFAGQKTNIGLRGTGFVVRRDGDRSWIVTAMHVVRDPDDYSIATKVEAELFTGPLPAGLLPPMLQVVRVPVPAASGDEPIVLEVRGLPPDIQALPLATTPAQGVLMVVGHPSKPGPWTVVSYPLLKTTDQALLLDGGLDPGASGSPVLSASRQVVGVVYDSPEVTKSRPIPQVWAFPVKALKAKMAS
jgi:tetratricopeptide (TPR) repeat protein